MRVWVFDSRLLSVLFPGERIELVAERVDADIVVDDWAAAVDYVASAGRIKDSKRARKWLASAELVDALSVFRLSLALGRWDWDAFRVCFGPHRLYEAVSGGRRDDVIEAWFELVGSRSAGAATSCLISFVSIALEDTTSSKWMARVVGRAHRTCDLSLTALSSVLLYEEGVPLEVAGLAAALSVARCL